MKYHLKLIVFLLIFSCNTSPIVIDEIDKIDVFENHYYNNFLYDDIINNNWIEIFQNNIEGFHETDINSLKFFKNITKEEEIYFQLRYDKDDKPKTYNEIRAIVVEIIKNTKLLNKQYKSNIEKSIELLQKTIFLLNNEKYLEVYNSFHSDFKEKYSYDLFISYIDKTKNLGIKAESREYFNKSLINSNNTEISFIEYHYAQKNNNSLHESFNFIIIDDDIFLGGYKLNFFNKN